MGDENTTIEAPQVEAFADAVEPEEDDLLAWYGVLAPTGVLSGDRRRFADGGITNRDLPLPMQWVEKASFGHDGAEVVGSIETITYEGGLIHFTGHRLKTERAAEVAEMIASGALRGVSVDLDSTVVEYVNEDGTPFDAWMWEPGDPEPIAQITEGRIAAATIVAIPAFQEAYVALGTGGEKPEFEEALTASAAPAYTLAAEQITYPADWFLDPEFEKVTPLTITEDGRVFGHAAAWGVCHLGFAQRECITAPHSQTDYGYFRLKTVLTEHGEMPVGTITIDTDHASLTMPAGQAMAHYDDTGKPIAYINVGEDKHGIWFAGAIRQSATAEEIEELRGSTLSGDWRPTPRGREFVGVLAVNVPGFPVPRTQFAQSTALGGEGALIAASIVRPSREALGKTDARRLDYQRLAASVVDEIEARQKAKDAREIGLARLRAATFSVELNSQARAAMLQRLRESYTDEGGER